MRHAAVDQLCSGDVMKLTVLAILGLTVVGMGTVITAGSVTVIP